MTKLLTNKKSFILSGVKPYRTFPSVRILMVGQFFMIAFVLISNFASINFALVCMVNSTVNDHQSAIKPTLNQSNQSSENCPTGIFENSTSNSENGYRGTYLWTRPQQSQVLSAIGIGSLLTAFLGGLLADRFGAKPVATVGLAIFTLTAALVPTAAHKGGWGGLFAMRFLQGFGFIIDWPATMVIANQWFPLNERGMLSAIGASGNQVGTIFSMTVSGKFCGIGGWGWEALFYTLAFVNGISLVCWIVFYKDSVETCPWVSEREASYILRTRGPSRKAKSFSTLRWAAIFTSLPVWAIIIHWFSFIYMYFLIAEYMPTYYKEVLFMDVGHTGYLSALPSIAQFVGRIVAGPLADRLERCITRNLCLKAMVAISGFGPAVFIAIVPQFDCSRQFGAVACFTLAYFFLGFAVVGLFRAPMLVAPSLTGTLTGLTQTAEFIAAIAVPYITGAIISDGTIWHWHMALYVATIFGISGTVVFLVFGSGEAQPWSFSGTERHRMLSIQRERSDSLTPKELMIIGSNQDEE